MTLFERILRARGLTGEERQLFLNPDYSDSHDPFLLPDMAQAVNRLVTAREKQEKIMIYGDYDIDGLTATALLLDALASFGFKKVEAFIPNRFVEGYGMTVDAVENIAGSGAGLIITVDCGSLSEKEIIRAGELGVDVIVTDHHNVAKKQPPAVAVVNPKRKGHKYPFIDLPGAGVAFKLVQALQSKLDGLPYGQEKWLLDLVALGTVCDVVDLRDENRTHVYWGLQVLGKTKRPGLRALMAVAGVVPENVDARSLGFVLGPRMNASGRLETAQHSLDMLTARDGMLALEKAQKLDEMNRERRSEQDKIYKAAILMAEDFPKDPVLVVSSPDWNHGIVGIVAAKLLEKYKKPSFVLQEMGESTKGSARSYGDFSAADAIRSCDGIITTGGGHKLAAGVTLPTENIATFRDGLNKYYKQQKLNLAEQQAGLLPKADVTINDLSEVNEKLLDELKLLEPFGMGNPEPMLKLDNALVVDLRKMGADNQYVKLEVQDNLGQSIKLISFNARAGHFVEPGERVDVWFQPTVNEWKGRRSVEGRLVHLQPND